MSFDPHSLLPKLVDLLLDTVLVVDEHGQLLFISADCQRLLGYTREELIGTSMLDLVHPDDRERTLATAAKVMSGVPQFDFENRYIRKDGESVHIQWSARWYESDRVRIGVARNVTALKRAETLQAGLYRISEAAHSTQDSKSLCTEIHRIIGDLVSADEFYVALYRQDDETISYAYFTDGRDPPSEPEPLQAESALCAVLRTGRATLARRDPQRPGQGVTLAGNANWLGAPLVTQGQTRGAVVIESRTGNNRYSEADLDVLRFVSSQIATAIERKQAQEKLQYLAYHDPLTGLTNRILFHDRLKMTIRRARRDGERMGLLYLDLNEFKIINDTLGHEAGDQVLCEVARRLVECTRESDTVARLGGDEFSIVLSDVSSPDSASLVIRRIGKAMADPVEVLNSKLSLSISIGMALFPEDGDTPESLLRHADSQMYAVKHNHSR